MGIVLTRTELVKGLEPLSGLDVAAVRSAFRRFEDNCPTPALWERAFADLLPACFPPGGPGGREAAHRAFVVLDTDGNALIDGRETVAGLAVTCKGHLTERMKLLFDIFDLNKEEELHFDECFLMLRRSMAGLRKLTGIVTPPEKVIQNMTKHIFKSATKHKNSSIVHQDWYNWWTSDATIRSALRMVTWKPEDQRGLPTPDQQLNVDYTKGAIDDDHGLSFSVPAHPKASAAGAAAAAESVGGGAAGPAPSPVTGRRTTEVRASLAAARFNDPG